MAIITIKAMAIIVVSTIIAAQIIILVPAILVGIIIKDISTREQHEIERIKTELFSSVFSIYSYCI